MLKFIRPVLLGLPLIVAAGLVMPAEPVDVASYSREQALTYSQAALGTRLADIELKTADGDLVAIESYRGKPLVISLIFTSCHHVCPSTTQYLQQVVNKARSVLGNESFQVLSVGFDTPTDNPESMASFRRSTGVTAPGWDFLAGDADNIAALVEQLGFIYYPSPRGFDHLVQASIIDGQGVVYRQVYGMRFPTPVLIEPLKDAVFERPTQVSAMDYLENRVRLFCTVYDPATDTYHIDISVFIGTFVGIMVSLLFGRVLYKEWRRSIKADS